MRRLFTWLLFIVMALTIAGLGVFANAKYETVTARGNSFDPSWGTQDGLRWGLQHMAELFPARTIDRGGDVAPMPTSLRDLSGYSYEFEGAQRSLAEFHQRNDTQAMLVLHRGRVVYETYLNGTDEATRFTSMSVAKSVTATLIGIAEGEGLIDSFDDEMGKYLPELRGTAYEHISIKHVLQMSSGVDFNEVYGPNNVSDVAEFMGLSLMSNLVRVDGKAASYPAKYEPGEKFNYSTAETQLLGMLLRSVTGKTQADYLTEKLWRPLGMSHDATWLLDRHGPDGVEVAGCCLNAAVRDYARIGQLYLRDGIGPDGTRILPDGWVKEATEPSSPQVQRGALYEDSVMGYQYQWWAYPGTAYSAEGVFGQFIYVDPAKDIVIVKTSAWPEGWLDNYGAEAELVFRTLADYLQDEIALVDPVITD